MSRFAPADLDELRDAIGEALAMDEPLEVLAGGSKRGLGPPLQLPRMLDSSRLAGIRDYQPSELVLTAGAATPIEEIDPRLPRHGRCSLLSRQIWGRSLACHQLLLAGVPWAAR
jgi:glycolate oxidase FAD binding subunit